MAEMLLLDSELGSASVAVVQARQRQIAETCDYYKLNVNDVAIMGGAALAMYSMDAVPTDVSSQHPFDVDGITTWPVIRKIMVANGQEDNADFIEETGGLPDYYSHRDAAHPIDLFNDGFTYGDPPVHVTQRVAWEASEILSNVGGGAGDYRVVHPRASAKWKLALQRPKDVAGILKGHASAHLQGLPVAEDPGWHAVVAQAAGLADYILTRGNQPAWLAQLRQRPGGLRSHKAFAFLDR